MNSYAQLINKHNGMSCFVFGAGPSLWHNMHEPFFPEIPKHGITLAVNSAVMAVPNFNYWISNDALCRRWSWWRTVREGKGIKVVRNSWEKYKEELEDFIFFNPRPTSEDIIRPGHLGLSYCSSVPSAIDLAIQMGCKKVFIFGLDHNDDKGKHHFWQYMKENKQPKATPPAQGPWEQQQTVFPINVKAFEALQGFADHSRVDVYNVNWIRKGSYFTKVDTFKKIEMGEIEQLIK